MPEPDRPPLTRERVVRTALDLIDGHGVDALSMRKLGSALGVEAMSLYNHVASKDDLLDGVADLLLELVEVPPPSGDWQNDVRALCAAVREVGRGHPRAFPLLVTQTRASFDSWAPVLAGFQTVRGAGLSNERAVQVVNAVSAYLVGFVLFEINARAHGRFGARAVHPEEVPADRPLLREYVGARHPVDFDAEFTEGIELLLRGVVALVAEPPSMPGAPDRPAAS